MTTPNKCRKAYDHWVVVREEIPFTIGSSYKLRETLSHNKYWQQELINVGRCKVYKGPECDGLMHCTSEDSYLWVRRIPEHLCESLAFNVVGAIQDLDKNGVPQSTIDRILVRLTLRAEYFINDAEAARLSVKSDWAGTAHELKDGYGPVYRLADEFLEIIRWIMAEAGINE